MNINPIATTPPMGWNSWNTFYDQINEETILQTADAIVKYSLKDMGYEYIIIDDCWQMKDRDENGNLAADPQKFPHGIKYVADYVHEKGLKFGIYSCCGTRTCGDYPGSFEHEFQDASLFASWGVDYLKYDNCHKPHSLHTPELYRRMSMAIRNCGRDIFLAACQWGTDDVQQWIRSTGVHSYRSTGDITDSWKSIENIAMTQIDKQAYAGPYCYNDMDMLVVGMYGGGNNPETSMGGCNDVEYQTHFALWAMLNSPLIIGCDIRKINKETLDILCNKEIIAINQDREGRGCYKLETFQSPDAFILIRPLENGDYAIGFFNFSDVLTNMTLEFWDMGLPLASGRGLSFYDCIEKSNIGIYKETYTTKVNVHGCRIYRCSLVTLGDV